MCIAMSSYLPISASAAHRASRARRQNEKELLDDFIRANKQVSWKHYTEGACCF
jgi:hypothetical protein